MRVATRGSEGVVCGGTIGGGRLEARGVRVGR
jgi:hypothetical protein